jgi:hypothetical protein
MLCQRTRLHENIFFITKYSEETTLNLRINKCDKNLSAIQIFHESEIYRHFFAIDIQFNYKCGANNLIDKLWIENFLLTDCVILPLNRYLIKCLILLIIHRWKLSFLSFFSIFFFSLFFGVRFEHEEIFLSHYSISLSFYFFF